MRRSRKYGGRRRSGADVTTKHDVAGRVTDAITAAYARRDVPVVAALVDILMSYEPGLIAYEHAFGALVRIIAGPVFETGPQPIGPEAFSEEELDEFDRYVRLDDEPRTAEEVVAWLIGRLALKEVAREAQG